MSLSGTHGEGCWLLTDIGGTHARFALYEAWAPTDAKPIRKNVVEAEEELTFLEALQSFLESAGNPPILAAALAIAAPVRGRVIKLTNRGWWVDIAALEQQLNSRELLLLNDFTAQALALPILKANDCQHLNDRRMQPDSSKVLLGPGTGLGMAALLPLGDGDWRPVVGEGGHMTQAAVNDEQAEVLSVLRRQFGHVSVERVVSGPGLVNLFQAISDLKGAKEELEDPAEVVHRAGHEQCPVSQQSLRLFTEFLAITASNAALAYGAFGGLYLTGGILQHLDELFDVQHFQEVFLDKGRFSAYLQDIPLIRVRHENATFPGLLNLLGFPEGQRAACAAYRYRRSS
ncbi:glucokinase [Fodinicurvata fenggangensis]|uniref:glucokinase n=1 Tax=Fodinicurvata fenggangensis TaxID=1121830 RepID=UPI00068F19D1|nr:glucokinase [Fodinicurvata fenggangensis]